MFTGRHKLNVDDKGRLQIPSRVRGQLAEACGLQLVITLGPECVEIYPAAEFRRRCELIKNMPNRDERTTVQRIFVGYAVETELDGQGRMIIPPSLRDKKKLNGVEVSLIGQIDHFELWPDSEWEASTEAAHASYAKAFAGLGV